MRIIDTLQTETVNARRQDTTFLPQGDVLVGQGDGVVTHNKDLRIFSSIQSLDGNGIQSTGPQLNFMLIGPEAEITSSGAYGIRGVNTRVENFGIIVGEQTGLEISGGRLDPTLWIRNSGKIEGGTAIDVRDYMTIDNTAEGVISGTNENGAGLHLYTQAELLNSGRIYSEGTAVIIENAYNAYVENFGVIRGVDDAIESEGSYIGGSVINRGLIVGKVVISTYDGRGGTVIGPVYGTDNANRLVAGSEGDRLVGLGGEDTLIGGRGDDLLNGNRGLDILFGRGGDDVINGGIGNDTIDGGKGKDIMRGGPGSDTYVIEPNSGSDTIHFSRVDRIDLSQFGLLDFDEDIVPKMSRVDDVTLIKLGDGDSLKLEGMLPNEIDSSDFIF